MNNALVKWTHSLKYYPVIILAALLASPVSATAQATLSGSITDGDGLPLPFAQVTLTLPNQDILYMGVLSDSLGSYEFTDIYYYDSLSLEVYSLGIRPSKALVLLVPGQQLIRDVKLLTVGEYLPQATVTEKRVAISIRGDTISFSVDAFLQGNERTLGDLIANIPDFRLGADGSISYQGKRIDKLLVEGRDVLNDQQGNATGTFGIEHILAIEVIENHRRPGDFLFGATEGVAVNVKLKEESRSRWVGRRQLAIGLPRNHELENKVTRVTARQGLSVNIAANTSGLEALTTQEYLNAQHSVFDLFDAMEGTFTLDDLVPSSLRSPRGLVRNAEGVVSLGYDRSLTDRNDLKVSLVTGLANRNYAYRFAHSSVERPSQSRQGNLVGNKNWITSSPESPWSIKDCVRTVAAVLVSIFLTAVLSQEKTSEEFRLIIGMTYFFFGIVRSIRRSVPVLNGHPPPAASSNSR